MMKRKLKTVITLLCALAVAINFMPETALAGAAKTGYLMYADSAWTYQYWSDPVDTGVVAKDVKVKGAGKYTVGLDFTKTADKKASGLSFIAVGIKDGEKKFPGYCIKINWIKVNGKKIKFTKGYTSSDDGKETRMNIYNSWVDMDSLDYKKNTVRSWDDSTKGISASIVDVSAFKSVKTVYVKFTVYKKASKKNK